MDYDKEWQKYQESLQTEPQKLQMPSNNLLGARNDLLISQITNISIVVIDYFSLAVSFNTNNGRNDDH